MISYSLKFKERTFMKDKEKLKEGLGKAFESAGKNAYFGNGFMAGVRFIEDHYNKIIHEQHKNIMKKVEPRPFNEKGEKDGNFNYIHQEDVATSFVNMRNITSTYTKD